MTPKDRLRAEIARYQPKNDQERADKAVIARLLEEDPHVAERSALAHLATSIWVVDPALEQTLFVHHNIYNAWSWIGGHADGEFDLERVAMRELGEETGIAHAALVPCGIYTLEVLTVNGHIKHGAYVSSHLHLNVTYLALADPADPVRAKPDENSGVAWVPLEDVENISDEPWIRTRVYRKLVENIVSVDPRDIACATDKLRAARAEGITL